MRRHGTARGWGLSGIGFIAAGAALLACDPPRLGVGGTPPSSSGLRGGDLPVVPASDPPPTNDALLEVDPAGGPPGAVITLHGRGFRVDDQVVVAAEGVAPMTLRPRAYGPAALIVDIPALDGVVDPVSLDVRVRRQDGETLGPLPFQLRPGRVFYVAPNGDDNNDGTMKAPLATVAAALGAMRAGDVTYLRRGHYGEQIFVPASVVGRADAPVVVSGMPGEEVWIEPTDKAGHDAISVHGGWIVIDRLRVTKIGATGAGVGIAADAFHVVVSNCEIQGAPGQGVMVSGQNNLIARNHIHHNGTHNDHDHGIYVEGGRNLIRDNVIHDNLTYGVHVYNETGSGPWGNNVIEYNLVYKNGEGASVGRASAGIVVAQHGDNTTIRWNRVCANAKHGIYIIDGVPGARVQANVTCWNLDTGLYFSAPGPDTDARGNVSYNDLGFALATVAGPTSNRNAFFRSSSNLRFGWNGKPITGLGPYQQSSRQDLDSMAVDPNFRNPHNLATLFDPAQATDYDFCTQLIPALCAPPAMATTP